MFLILMVFACEKKLDEEWTGTCDIDGETLDVLLEIDEESFGTLGGSIEFSEGLDSGRANFDGTRGGDDVELLFDFTASGYTWDVVWLGEIDDDEMGAEVTFTGSDYETTGQCDVKGD